MLAPLCSASSTPYLASKTSVLTFVRSDLYSIRRDAQGIAQQQKPPNLASNIVSTQFRQLIHGHSPTLATIAKVISRLGVKPLGDHTMEIGCPLDFLV